MATAGGGQQQHGLAATLRASIDSETFDLAGQTAATISSTITSAFSEPFALDHMIRLTFVTGAGKLGRQKYDDGAAKAVTASLRSLDYEEDKGASCVIECGGSFKMQHDTGKNLKTVVVFPKITNSTSASGGGDKLKDGVEKLSVSITDLPPALRKNTPENTIAISSMNIFERMADSKCPTWAQKKGLLQAVTDVQKLIKSYESILLSGEPLLDFEQDFYDSISGNDLSAKEGYVRRHLASQVEAGQVTKREKATLLAQVVEKLSVIDKDMKKADAEKSSKTLELLKGAKDKARARQKMLEEIIPQPPAPLKFEGEILKLRRELIPLQKLEDETKGRLLSIKETQSLARVSEIHAEIRDFEQKSRGWFEENDAFQDRVSLSHRIKDSKKGGGQKKLETNGAASGGTYKVKSPVTKWITPNSSKNLGKPVRSAASKPSRGGVFAAMMDSDSDNE